MASNDPWDLRPLLRDKLNCWKEDAIWLLIHCLDTCCGDKLKAKCHITKTSYRPQLNASWQKFQSEIDCEWLNGLTGEWRFLPSILQDKTFIWSHIIAAYNSVSSNLNLVIRFCIVPPKVSRSICSHYISSLGDFWCSIAFIHTRLD